MNGVLLAVSFVEVGEIIVGVTASTLGVIGLVARFKERGPVRWVLTQLVVQPASEAIDRHLDGKVTDAVGAAVTEAMTGLNGQVDRLGMVVHSIHYEMHPNSGSSLRDVLDRVEHTSTSTASEVEHLRTDVTDLRDRTARLEGSVDILKAKG